MDGKKKRDVNMRAFWMKRWRNWEINGQKNGLIILFRLIVSQGDRVICEHIEEKMHE